MNSWTRGHFCLVAMMLVSACSAVDTSQQAQRKMPAEDPAQIQFNQPLHFSTPDGSDAVVQAGTYQVQQASDSQLRLVSTTAAPPILLNAQVTRSTSDVPSPVALGTLYESEVYHLILLLPGNTALETHGSVSGVQTRGGFGAQKGMVFLKADKLALPPTQSQPLPDLVPTCGRVTCFNLPPAGGTNCYLLTGAVNQGAAAAGPSQAKNGANTQAVPALQPGQLQGLVFGVYYGPPPSTVQVDVANQVIESNEQNNSGQLCP